MVRSHSRHLMEVTFFGSNVRALKHDFATCNVVSNAFRKGKVGHKSGEVAQSPFNGGRIFKCGLVTLEGSQSRHTYKSQILTT